MAFTALELSRVRRYVGTPPTDEDSKIPTDEDIDAQAVLFETTSPYVVARHYVGMWLADMEVGGPAIWNLTGRYSQNRELNIKRLASRLAELDRIVEPGSGNVADPPRDPVPIERDDRDRLFDNA